MPLRARRRSPDADPPCPAWRRRRVRGSRPGAVPAEASASSAKSLNIRGDVANVLGGQALGNGPHDVARPGRAGARCVVIQLPNDVIGMLAAQLGKLRQLVAATGRPMTRHACGNTALLVAASEEFLTDLTMGGIRFRAGGDLTVEIGSYVRHVLGTQGRRHRKHDGVLALAVLEVLQLLDDVIRPQAREARPLSVGTVAVCAVTGLADGGLGGTGLGVAGRQRGIADEHAGQRCGKNPKSLHVLKIPSIKRTARRVKLYTRCISSVPSCAHVIYPNVKFVTSAAEVHQLAPDAGREIAFAGRSNAGKSTAINAITQRAGLARVSRTPGRTQLINFFEVASDRRLVDLPGYGFAKVPERVRTRWLQLMEHYFNVRESLVGLVLIVDSRRGP